MKAPNFEEEPEAPSEPFVEIADVDVSQYADFYQPEESFDIFPGIMSDPHRIQESGFYEHQSDQEVIIGWGAN